MTNFATSRAPESAHFPDRITRRIVVVHVATLAVIDLHRVNQLRIAQRRQRHNVQPLGHAARKDTRTMRSWQYAHLGAQRANFVELTTIWTQLLLDDTATHVFMKCHRERLIVLIMQFLILFLADLLAKRLVKCPTQLIHHLITLWIWMAQFVTQFIRNPRIYLSLHILIWQYQGVFLCGWLDFRHQFLLQFNRWLVRRKRPLERLADHLFGHLICARFNHRHAAFNTRHHDVEITFGTLFWGQKGLKFAIDTPNTQTRHRTIKRRTRQRQRRTRSDHTDHIWAEIWIHRQHTRHHLYLLAIALRKQRTNRTIDQTTNQNRFIRRTSLALDKSTAADLASCIKFFFIINAQREIIQLHRSRTNLCRPQHHRITVAHQHTRCRAKTYSVNFERQRLPMKISGNRENLFTMRVNNRHTCPPFSGGK